MTTAQKNEKHEKQEKTASRRPAKAPEIDGMWENAMKMQRQWMDAFMRPMGFTPSTDEAFDRGEAMTDAWLDHVKRMNAMTHELANDELAMMRELTEEAFRMSRGMSDRDPETVTPDLTRTWLETTRRGTERFYSYGVESMKSVEKLGLKMNDLMMPERTKA